MAVGAIIDLSDSDDGDSSSDGLGALESDDDREGGGGREHDEDSSGRGSGGAPRAAPPPAATAASQASAAPPRCTLCRASLDPCGPFFDCSACGAVAHVGCLADYMILHPCTAAPAAPPPHQRLLECLFPVAAAKCPGSSAGRCSELITWQGVVAHARARMPTLLVLQSTGAGRRTGARREGKRRRRNEAARASQAADVPEAVAGPAGGAHIVGAALPAVVDLSSEGASDDN